MGWGNKLVRAFLFFVRFIQWGSAVVVMGIMSFFIQNFSQRNLIIKYVEIISAISVAFFLPGLLSPFLPRIAWITFPIDIAFSYLWLTAFIFLARDYNVFGCFLGTPLGGSCAVKRAMEAFTFVTFFMCLLAALLEIYNLWSYKQRSYSTPIRQKEMPRTSADTGYTATV